MRVVLCCTHPNCSNGYALVGYELCRRLQREGVEVHVFGFQNIGAKALRALPPSIPVYDAAAHEKPLKNGFGFEAVGAYVAGVAPDVVIVYNDSVVVQNILQALHALPDRRFKTVVYQDQVYEHMKRVFVDGLNNMADMVLAFTPYWMDVLRRQGVTRPRMEFLRHGFDASSKFPVPMRAARECFGLSQEDFIILNLNRNQPRKRWDVCMTAFAEFLSRHRGERVKLLVGTAPQGAWNLMEVFIRELGKRGIDAEEGCRHVVLVQNAQQLSDQEVNILMNCADVGVNTADGEGFGLCNFEHAGVGRPQIVSRLGGFLDFFDDTCAHMCDPVVSYYVDAGRDGVGGEARIVDYRDVARGMEAYYTNPEMRARHGAAARARVLGQEYSWQGLADKLHALCVDLCAAPPPTTSTENN